MKLDYGIFIFRKDLRINDNRGLIKLSKLCKKIIPIFIFDSNQMVKNDINKNYLSYPALRFLCESIYDLSQSIKKQKSHLYIFHGKPIAVLKYIIKKLSNINNFDLDKLIIGFNEDFTKYALERDDEISKLCKTYNINICKNDDDSTMCSMELLLKDDKTPYKQYGAFQKNMLLQKFNQIDNSKIDFINIKIHFDKLLDDTKLDIFWKKHLDKNYNPKQIGNRSFAINKLKNLKKFKDYMTMRDNLSYETTNLSAYLNFGLISEREFYYSIKKELGTSQLINQIIWRDYYITLLRYLDNANSYIRHIDDRYNKLKWTNTIPDKNNISWKEWELMMNSQTGFLIVDAAIKELLTTGYMHNRCRMIVGVFSVKYLLINPLCRYVGLNDWFSRHLVDCCASQNKLNCQWVTELDFPGKKFSPKGSVIAGRPMNISNIMIKKWDNDCTYIKKWLPHLNDIDNKILYNWDTKYDIKFHPKPMFNAKDRYQKWLNITKN